MSTHSAEAHCKHFVARKKRYCKMTLKAGEEYCGEHQPRLRSDFVSSDSRDSRRRIVCPLDPKHTCYATKLKQHLKKCNAKLRAAEPYINKNINAEVGDSEIIKSRSLGSVPVDCLLEIIEKVDKLHFDVIKDSIVENILFHSILNEELANPEYGYDTKKHLQQVSAILALMKEYNLLQPDTCYVEFGAGKGKLSYWVSKTLESLEHKSSSVLLVERASHRHKYDNKLDKASGQVVRIRADIADLILSKVDIIEKAKHVVGFTKHLCGDATDLALRCLVNCQKNGKSILGVIMAFCCHHRCQWHSYTGKRFFESVGLSKNDFDAMCGMVSWAVCGTGKSRELRQQTEVDSDQNNRDIQLGVSRKQKKEIGKKCKDLLNWGRKVYLEDHNFQSVLCSYVNSDVSLENMCIIGTKQN